MNVTEPNIARPTMNPTAQAIAKTRLRNSAERQDRLRGAALDHEEAGERRSATTSIASDPPARSRQKSCRRGW